jgi:hypothetical protein
MKFLVLFILVLLFSVSSFSQGLQVDSLVNQQEENVIRLYNNYTDGNAPIYNGTAYLSYSYLLDGNPFFNSEDSSYGWISYLGIKYELPNIQYDITRDQVIILYPDIVSKVVLHNEFIDSFYLGFHTFIRLMEDHQLNLVNTGFYDLLYKGKVCLWARRIKTMEDIIKSNATGYVFYSKDRFYIFKNGLYYLVENKNDVFRLMSDRQHDLKTKMRQEHLKFHRKNFETTLIKVTSLYDQLTR